MSHGDRQEATGRSLLQCYLSAEATKDLAELAVDAGSKTAATEQAIRETAARHRKKKRLSGVD